MPPRKRFLFVYVASSMIMSTGIPAFSRQSRSPAPSAAGVKNLTEKRSGGFETMAKRKINYELFYKEGQQVKLGVRLSSNLLRECNGEISSFAENRAKVEILGAAPKAIAALEPGARVTLSGWSGWGFYCAEAILTAKISPKEFDLRLEGVVEEIQRREYFRLDVSLPVRVTIPDQQTITALSEQWEKRKSLHQSAPSPRMSATAKGYRAIAAHNEEILPQEVNLSGGGLRMRMQSAVKIGSRIHVDLLLPLNPPRIISTVAETLRSSEVTLRVQQTPLFIVAMKFILIEEKDREAIIAFLFAEQRQQLQTESVRDLPSSAR